ncbi:MAG: ATP-binding protein [Promethearchaeota archaeon]
MNKNNSEDLEKIKTTKDIPIPTNMIGQVVGQAKAIQIIKIAAKERRNVLLLGNPGTGKSMLGKAYADLMPKETRPDILVYPNYDNPNSPEIIKVEANLGQPIVSEFKSLYAKSQYRQKIKRRIPSILIALIYLVYFIVTAKFEITSFLFMILVIISLEMIFSFQKRKDERLLVPNLIICEDEDEKDKELDFEDDENNKVDNKKDDSEINHDVSLEIKNQKSSQINESVKENSKDAHIIPEEKKFSHSRFIDATGVEVGRLLGDVKHDPYESGGLGTPPHERVMPGAIHLANKGVLFIDEIGTLAYDEQISLLTAMQERYYPIAGRSAGSSSSLIQTKKIPCDFALVAAGNYETVELLHPAFRSRFLGYGYEVRMDDSMPDTKTNRYKLAQFIAQEVYNDQKLIHFDKTAINEILQIAQKLSPKPNSFTLSLRKLGGYVRTASDIAKNKSKSLVAQKDVQEAFEMLKPIEAQDTLKIEPKTLEGYLIEGMIYIPSERASSQAIGIIKIAILDNNQNSYNIIGREEDQYIKSQITIAQAMVSKHFHDENIFQKSLIIQFEGEAKKIQEGIGLAIFLCFLSAMKKIKIKKNETAIGDIDILGNIILPSYTNIRILNAKSVELKQIHLSGETQDNVEKEGLIYCKKVEDLLKSLR